MKCLILVCIGLFLQNIYAQDEDFEVKFNPILDAQAKNLHNPTENMTILSGQFGAQMKLFNGSLNAVWLARYAQSKLYEKSNLYAQGFAIYPTRVVNRELFKVDNIKTTNDHYSESIISNLYYQWEDEDFIFKGGRFDINYGEGLTFNPINPFHLPLTYSSYGFIKQGNDGLEFDFLSDPKLKLYLYLLGDRSINDYDNRISRTIFVRGSYAQSEQAEVGYILGEDEKRHKYGIEYKYSLPDSFIFGQFVRNTKRLDTDNSYSLTNYVLGYEKDLSSVWTIRIEGGKNDQDEKKNSSLYLLSQLPMKNFAALLTHYQISDALSLKANLANDPKSSLTYGRLAMEQKIGKYLEMQIYGGSVLSKNEEKSIEQGQTAGLFIPNELGLGVRYIF